MPPPPRLTVNTLSIAIIDIEYEYVYIYYQKLFSRIQNAEADTDVFANIAHSHTQRGAVLPIANAVKASDTKAGRPLATQSSLNLTWTAISTH